jgi:general secretion pathway protein N
MSSLAIDKVRGRVPVDYLGQRFLPGLSLAGVLETDELSLTVEEGYPVEASGRLAWSNAGVEAPYRMGLGGVVVDLSTENDGIVFRLGDTGGALQAAGLGLLSPEGKYSFNGSLGSRRGADSELATYLQILGRPQPDGMVKIQHNGSLVRLL